MNRLFLTGIIFGFIVTVAGLLIWGMSVLVWDAPFDEEFSPFLAAVIPGSNKAVFYFSPETGNHNVGATFPVQLRVAASSGVTSVKAYVNFNPALLQAQSISITGSAFPNWFEQVTDNVNGIVKLQAGTPAPGFSGSGASDGLIATVTFRVLNEGVLTLAHNAGSLALKPTANDENILDLVNSTGASFVADSTAPNRSAGSPTGELVYTTTLTSISLATNENATCKYSVGSDATYAVMASTFSGAGTKAHTATVSGLASGGNYSYYARCQDALGNTNLTGYPIEFSVAVPPAPAPAATSSSSAASSSSSSPSSSSASKKGDFNGDNNVNIIDLSILLSNWNKSVLAYDLGGSAILDIFDLSILLSSWTG